MLNQDIIYKEDYKIFDKLAENKQSNGPIGWVRIFLNTKHGMVYDEGSNLVIAQGREFVAQKVFDTNLYSGGTRPDWRNYKISHFAVGAGGSTVLGSPPTVTLNGPYICDTTLISTTSLGTAGYLTEPSGTVLSVKPIISDGGSSYLEPVSYTGGSGSCSYYTKMKCTCIVPSGEPTTLAPGGTTKIDEAGLYFVYSASVYMFSHICFAPKWKEKESTLTIQWYILF